MTTTPKLWKSLTQVNATDGGTEQIDGQIAGLQDGGYFVVWTDSNSHAHSAFAAIMGQRYDATGNKVGGEVHVSTGFVGPGFPASVSSPAATVLPNGNIAVAFEYIVEESGGGLINDRNIYVRIFDPALNILRTDTIATGTNQTFHPSITAFGDGSYVVSYTVGVGDAPSVIADTDIVARIVSPTGVVGSQFDIDNQDDNRDNSQLATLSNGNFVVVYQDEFAGSPTDTDILYQVRAPNGSPVTGGVVPGGDGSGPEFDPHVAALRDGGFVVVWTDQIGASVSDIRTTIFSNAGDPVASSIRVNTTLGISRPILASWRWPTAASWSRGKTPTSVWFAGSGSAQSATRSAPSSRCRTGRPMPAPRLHSSPMAGSGLPSATFPATPT
jgi:hypothetical protein